MPARSHGKSHDPAYQREYRAWAHMRDRCHRTGNPRHHRYGGRGIVICDRWGDFSAFLSDMGPCPAGMTLERRNNDGPYDPDNCEWATRQAQHDNQTHVNQYTGRIDKVRAVVEQLLGENVSISAIMQQTGISRASVYRIKAALNG